MWFSAGLQRPKWMGSSWTDPEPKSVSQPSALILHCSHVLFQHMKPSAAHILKLDLCKSHFTYTFCSPAKSYLCISVSSLIPFSPFSQVSWKSNWRGTGCREQHMVGCTPNQKTGQFSTTFCQPLNRRIAYLSSAWCLNNLHSIVHSNNSLHHSCYGFSCQSGISHFNSFMLNAKIWLTVLSELLMYKNNYS